MNKLTKSTIEFYLNKLKHVSVPVLNETCPNKTLNREIKETLSTLNFKELDSYIKSNLKHKFKLLKTPHTKFAIVSIYSLCGDKQNKNLIQEIIFVLSIIYYNNLLNKYIRYCNDLLLHRAFAFVKKSNLFKHDIKEGLTKLAADITDKIGTSCEISYIITRLYELRHRIAQSLKSVVKKYYDLYQNPNKYSKINYHTLATRLAHNIVFYATIPVSDKCPYKDEFIYKLPDADEHLLTDSIEEILDLIGTSPSLQKISGNLHKLQYTVKLLKSIDIEVNRTSLLCFVSIIIRRLKDERNH